MNEKFQPQSEQLSELKAKLEIYEKWYNEQSKLSRFPNFKAEPRLAAVDEISIREIFDVLWHGKWLIMAITFVFAMSSVFYALSLPNIYKSEALLMPNSQEQKSGIGTLAGQFGGLASLAGISLGGGSTDKTGYALEVLKSREFLYKFIASNDLKVPIMAVDGWDRETNTYTFDDNVYNSNAKKWVRKVKAPFYPEPSINETYEKFLEEHLTVSQDKDTGMVTLGVYHYSPILAKQLVDKLISALNFTIKKQDMEEAIKSINYFEEELNNTSVAGAQTMFYQLIEQQQQTLMLTKVRDDYVLKVIDSSVVAEQKSKPKRALICILGVMLGLLSSILLVLASYIFRENKEISF